MTDRRPPQVRYQPALPLRAVLGWGTPAVGAWPFPLDQPRLALTYSGTAAIAQAFRALRLPAGSVVLCPSYNCGHEIEPLLRLGLQVRCYRIAQDLTIDCDDLERRIDGAVRAVLVTHFFGFGQALAPLRALCDRHGLFLVEDCAHAFLSDTPAGDLGRVGDVAVYSIRKSLPLPNGGGVLVNNPTLAVPEPARTPPGPTTWLKTLELTRKSVVDRWAKDRTWRYLLAGGALAPLLALGTILRESRWGSSPVCYDPDDESFDFDAAILDWSVAPLSRRILGRLDWREVANRRRSNYRRLAEELHGLEGCQVLWPDLPDSTVPLFLPLLVRHRADVCRFLVQHRISPAIWWDQRHPAVEWGAFPEARELKDRVLALPVHQDVDERQLDHLVATLRRCPAL